MKPMCLLILTLLVSTSSLALVQPTSPGLQVLSFSFKQTIVAQVWDRQDRLGRLIESPPRGEDRFEPSNSILAKRHPNSRDEIRFRYATLFVRNTGTKMIKAIEWDYVHPHVAGKKVLLRREARSKVNLGPNEERVLQVSVPEGGKRCPVAFYKPAGTTNGYYFSTRCNARGEAPYGWDKERARLRRVEYADGTVWQGI